MKDTQIISVLLLLCILVGCSKEMVYDTVSVVGSAVSILALFITLIQIVFF